MGKNKLWIIGTFLLLSTLAWTNYSKTKATQSNDGLPGRNFTWRDSDSQIWVMSAQEAMQEHDPLKRNHFINFDNAPQGRKQFWASHLTWITLAGAQIRKSFTKEDINTAIEEMALFTNPLILAIGGTLIAIIAINLLGGPLGTCTTIIFLITLWFSPFNAGHYDHHGIIQLALTGTILGIIGATKKKNPKPWMILAGVSTGILLWTSAFTAIPIIAALSIGGTLLTLNNQSKPLPWHIWGNTATLVGFATYLIEYSPNQFTLLLDTNNPLYCACTWVAGQIPSTALAWKTYKKPIGKTILLLLIGSLPLLLLLFLSSSIMYTLNQLGIAHMNHPTMQSQEMGKLDPVSLPAIILLPILTAFFACQQGLFKEKGLALLGLILCGTGLFLQMNMIRNSPIALPLLLGAILIQKPIPTWTPGLFLPLAFLACFIPNSLTGFRSSDILRQMAINHTIPTESILITNPDASIPLAYYLGGKSGGSPYWENWPNLEQAHAKIALGESDALKLLPQNNNTVLIAIQGSPLTKISKDILIGKNTETFVSLWDELEAGQSPPGWEKLSHPGDKYQIYTQEKLQNTP